MFMQIGNTFEKTTSKSCHCIKNRIIMSQLILSFKPKANFIHAERLGVCQLHLESIQQITGIGFHSLKDNKLEAYKIFSKVNLIENGQG